MRFLQLDRWISVLTSRESGITMIETVVALAIIGVIAVTFLSGLGTASRATVITDVRSTTESLARSQIEHAQNADYAYGATQYSAAQIPSGDDYANYSTMILAEPLHDPDDGIQKITVIVKHSDAEIARLESYKVDR